MNESPSSPGASADHSRVENGAEEEERGFEGGDRQDNLTHKNGRTEARWKAPDCRLFFGWGGGSKASQKKSKNVRERIKE